MTGPPTTLRRWRLLCATALVALFAVPASPARAGYDEAVTEQGTIGHTGFASGGSLAPPPLGAKWSRNLGTSTSYPLIAAGEVFVVASDSAHTSSTLFALDGQTGATVWSRPVGSGAKIAYDSGRVFVVDATTTVTSVSADTGLTLWVKALNSNSTPNAPVAVGGRLYLQVPAYYDPLYAIDETDGSVLWQSTRLTTGGSPAVDGANVYVTGPSCSTLAVNRDSGRQAWLRQPPGCNSSTRWAVADGSRVFSNGFMYGSALGDYRDTIFGGMPAVAGNTSVTLNGRTLQARDVNTGVLQWEYAGDPNLASVPTVVNGTAYIGTSKGRLIGVDMASGQEVWSSALVAAPTSTYDLGPTTVGLAGMASGGGLLVAPVAGTVFALSSDTPPAGTDLRITAGPNGPTTSTSASFAFTAGAGDFTYRCRLDGGDWQVCAATRAYASVADGPHAFEVKTVSAQGADLAVASRSWSVSTTTPKSTIQSGPPALTANNYANFAFSTTASASLECRLDAGEWKDCSSGTMSYSYLTSADHVFEVRGTSPVGIVESPPVAYRWTVDTVSPTARIDAGPTSSTTARTAEFRFSSTDSTARFECHIDSGDFKACTSPATYADLSTGYHYFYVRAIDPAGNTSYSESRSWSVTDPPVLPDTSITSQPAFRSPSANPYFSFTGTNSPTGYECRLDGGAWEACSYSRSYNALPDGSHSFEVRAINGAGTDPTPAAYAWTIDTQAADTAIDEAPSGVTASRSVQVRFSSADTGARFECALDGAAFAACSSPQSLTGLPAGPHTFRVRAVDAAGNADATPASAAWTVGDPPDTTISAGPTGSTRTTSAAFEFSSPAASASFECRLDGGAWTACSSPHSRLTLADGEHTFEVRASSGGLTDPSPASRTWTVDTAAPDTTIDAGSSGPVGSDGARFAFSSSEPGGSYQCQLDSGAFAGCASPVDYTGLVAGDHTFRVRAADAAGNVDATPALMTFTLVSGNPPTGISVAPRADALTRRVRAYAVSVAQAISRIKAPKSARSAAHMVISFSAPRAGVLRGQVTMRSGRRVVVLAQIARRYKRAGSARPEIRLTAAGRSRLAARGRTRMTVTTSFAPSDRSHVRRASVGVTRFGR